MESGKVQLVNVQQLKRGAHTGSHGKYICRRLIKIFHECRSWLLPVIFTLTVLGASCSPGTGLDIYNHQLTVRQFTGDLNSTRSVAIVSGEARNNGQSAISNPVIEVTFYGAQKDIIGTAQAYTSFLEPGGIWSFSAQLTSPDAWKVRDYSITGSAK